MTDFNFQQRDPRRDFARCRPHLEAALRFAQGTHTIDDVADGITTGQYQFWPGKQCALVTEIYEFPQFKALNFFLAGGDLDEILSIEPQAIDFGRFHGCTMAIMTGRKGWERVLKPLNWQPNAVVFGKPIDQENRSGV